QLVRGRGGQRPVGTAHVALHVQQLGQGVRGRVGELQEVARVEPATLDVDRRADLLRYRGQLVGLRVGELRRVVHARGPVGEVRRPAVQQARYHVGAVALDREEVDRVGRQRPEQVPAEADLERRRHRAGRL